MLVARLREQRAAGKLSGSEVRVAAHALAIGERTLWRWIADGPPARARGRPAYRLTDADREAFATACGSATGAWRLRRTDGVDMPPLRTFQAPIARELLPIERAAVA